MAENVTQMVTTRPDAEFAADLKAKLTEALVPVTALMAEASRRGFLVQWDNIGPDAFGRFHVNGMRLVKHF